MIVYLSKLRCIIFFFLWLKKIIFANISNALQNNITFMQNFVRQQLFQQGWGCNPLCQYTFNLLFVILSLTSFRFCIGISLVFSFACLKSWHVCINFDRGFIFFFFFLVFIWNKSFHENITYMAKGDYARARSQSVKHLLAVNQSIFFILI